MRSTRGVGQNKREAQRTTKTCGWNPPTLLGLGRRLGRESAHDQDFLLRRIIKRRLHRSSSESDQCGRIPPYFWATSPSSFGPDLPPLRPSTNKGPRIWPVARTQPMPALAMKATDVAARKEARLGHFPPRLGRTPASVGQSHPELVNVKAESANSAKQWADRPMLESPRSGRPIWPIPGPEPTEAQKSGPFACAWRACMHVCMYACVCSLVLGGATSLQRKAT